MRVEYPEGPIVVKRFNPQKGETPDNVKEVSISPQMIWRIANALSEGLPVNFDRLLGASYNTRSVLEALLAHTPQFYLTRPGRIEMTSSTTQIKRGHKHLLWRPSEPHEPGVIRHIDIDLVISELPAYQVIYEPVELPTASENQLDIQLKRRHAQIQVALIKIGQHLGYRTYIAQNDQAILYEGQPIAQMDGVVTQLNDEPLFKSFEGAARRARLIDCIWFRNHMYLPAVMEIEHTTGVTSGLNRMRSFQSEFPPISTRYVIVAPDEDREKVIEEANKEQFRPLMARFFPYSAVEELYSLCQRRKIRGTTDEFLDAFMEPVCERP